MKRLNLTVANKFCFILGLILFASSCKEEDSVNKKKSFVITIDASSMVAWGQGAYIILVSDRSGNTVSYNEVRFGEKYDFSIEGKFDDDTFTLTELAIYSTSVASSYSFMGLPTENITWTPRMGSIPIRQVSFTFTNSPVAQTVFASTNYSIQTLASQVSSQPGMLFITNNSSYLLASSRTGTQVKYKLFTNDNVGYSSGNSYAINLSSITTDMPVKSSLPPSDATNINVTVKGILKSGPGKGYYFLPNPGPVQLIPDLGTLFEDYLYFYSFTKGNYEYFNRVYSSPDVEPLAMTITSKSKSNQSLTYVSSGTYDYDRIYAKNTSSTGGWYVYAPASDKEHSIMIPTVPSEVIAKYPITNPSNYQLQTFTATDLKSVSNYLDFFAHRDQDFDITAEVKTSSVTASNL